MSQKPEHIETDSVSAHGSTHTGQVKKVNEDRFLIHDLGESQTLFAVADGLGGDFCGDIAAQTAVDDLKKLRPLSAGNEKKSLEKTVHEIDLHICSKIESQPTLEGMATTLVCGVLIRDTLSWINVGDSRLYLIRSEQIYRITTDQTLARFLYEEGEITAEQVDTHYSKDLLEQCVGYGECHPEKGVLLLKNKDLLLFATDGLHNFVSDARICRILNNEMSLQRKADTLVRHALDNKGNDNITVLLVRIGRE